MIGDDVSVRVTGVNGRAVTFEVKTPERTATLTRGAPSEFQAGPATVVLCGIRGAHQVRLGFRAPREINVLREELYQRDQAAQPEAQPA
ncbi:MAG: carbon storage regulator [Salinibacterium sp.]|nr:carbon storage regulator [Salinibacterium sp.]